VNLPELSRDERAALAFLMRTAAKFGPEKCWPTVYSIGLAIGKKRRTVSRVMTALAAFGIIERIERGPESNRYRMLLNSDQLTEIIGAAFRKDGAAFGAACEKALKVKEITLVKPRKSRANCAASPSLCPPTPQRRNPMSQMPEMYAHDPIAQKLWRMAQRWIALNNPDLTEVTGDKSRPIMYALEGAGALDLPEDGPLPMITWPQLEAAPLISPAPTRKTAASAGFVRELKRQTAGGDQ
jgi:DNA-binding transcriptional ArsR family regulator